MPIKIRLAEVMIEKQVSLTELANRTGVTMSNLSNIKRGKIRLVRFSTLEAICKSLDCQPGNLFEHTNEEID